MAKVDKIKRIDEIKKTPPRKNDIIYSKVVFEF